MTPVSQRFPISPKVASDLFHRLKVYSARHDVKIRDFVEDAVVFALEQRIDRLDPVEICGEDLPQVSVRIDIDLVRKMKVFCIERDFRLREFVATAIRLLLDKRESSPGPVQSRAV